MGSASIFFTLGLIFVGIVWYYFYGRKQVSRDGAVFHIFARLGQRQDPGLDRELRGILQEKGLREEDPFDMVIARAGFLDFKNEVSFEKIVGRASETLAERTGLSPGNLKEGFMQGTRVGATPVSHGVALPHLRLSEIEHPELVMVRARKGVLVDIKDEYIGKEAPDSPVHAFFFLISPEEEPRQHLRLLAQIAEHAADDRFLERWLAAKKQHSVKALLHRDEHFLSLKLSPDSWTAELIGRSVRDLNMPAGSLIAIIHRGRDIVFPSGNTVLEEGDRLTIIGEPLGIQRLRQQFIPAD